MSRRIIRSRLADNIYLVRFKTQYELAATFLRVQEYYESGRFSGRVFTLEEYMDWYASRFGAFTYYEDWSGFNVPSTSFKPFYEGKFDPLLEKEKRLLRLFRHERAPYYVIGVAGTGSRRDVVHELAHALFFTDATYRQAVRTAMRKYDTSAMEDALARMGYARRVLQDEVHAYLVAPTGAIGRSSPAFAPLRKRLRALFTRHSRGLSLPAISRARSRALPPGS